MHNSEDTCHSLPLKPTESRSPLNVSLRRASRNLDGPDRDWKIIPYRREWQRGECLPSLLTAAYGHGVRWPRNIRQQPPRP